MKDISAPFGGDQLTRAIVVGEKDLHQCDHVSPFPVELFHTKMSLLQVGNVLLACVFYNVMESTKNVSTMEWFTVEGCGVISIK